MVDKVMFSSKSVEWPTPQPLFDNLDKEFHFTLDPAATKENAKCENYYTVEDNGLMQPWTGNVWLNPPYGKGRIIEPWIDKTVLEVCAGNCMVVALLPARVDTIWFHEGVFPYVSQLRFIYGRLKFEGGKDTAPFPSVIAVYDGIPTKYPPPVWTCDKLGNIYEYKKQV